MRWECSRGSMSPKLGAADPGTKAGPAPRFGIGDMNLYRPLVGTHVDDVLGLRHHGLVTFAGGATCL
jgi:hypothetical protein